MTTTSTVPARLETAAWVRWSRRSLLGEIGDEFAVVPD